MAVLDIDVNVNGAEQLNTLDNTIKEVKKDTEDLGQTAQKTSIDWASFGKTLTGVTVIATGVGLAFKKVIDAGVEMRLGSAQMQKNLEAEETAWNRVKASLSDVLGLTEAKIEHDKAVLLGMQRIESFITGKSIPAIQAETRAIEARTKAMADWKTMFEDSLDSYIDKLSDQIDREEYAEEVRDRYLERQKLREQAYEDELALLDASIDMINKRTEAEIEASQAVEDATESIEDKTEALEEATKATEEATQALQAYSSSAGTISGAEAYAKYAIGYSSTSAIGGANDRAILDALNEIAQSSQDTNDAVRGY